ncbi:HdeD family acid-resistance protein [uncultured Thiodictyon sp.]|uniref:HdeD family acid-resistance protein n=1 Tax=uncultured Thiodictyon sp. TaxID=1846217 RepID=UPI0025FF2A5B|nr:HdeD family acid-resistance protein [uncultured Thiodictyon sp.]
MSDIEIAPLPAAQIALFGDLQKNWGWLLGLGVLSIVLGTIGLGASFSLTLVTVLFFGWLLLVGGGFQLVGAFSCRGWRCVLEHVLAAALYILAGYLIVQDPLLASGTFTLIIAGVLVAVGLLRIVMAIQHRGSPGWVWAVLGGIISMLLGGVIFAQWPVSGTWVIGLFVAVELLLNGWASIFVALAARRVSKAQAPAAGSAAAAT